LTIKDTICSAPHFINQFLPRLEICLTVVCRGSWMHEAGRILTFFSPEENLHFPTNFLNF